MIILCNDQEDDCLAHHISFSMSPVMLFRVISGSSYVIASMMVTEGFHGY